MLHNEVTSCVLDLQEVIFLDIDPHMVVIEKILTKYYDAALYTSGVHYVKGRRYAEPNRGIVEAARAKNLVTTEPWHPVLGITLLKNMLTYFQYAMCDEPALFVTNPLTPGISLYPEGSFNNDINIIIGQLDNVTDSDLTELCNLFLDMHVLITSDPLVKYCNNILSLDTTTNIYKLMVYEDVRIFRFKESIHHGCVHPET